MKNALLQAMSLTGEELMAAGKPSAASAGSGPDTELRDLLIEVAQLLNGWAQDGSAWSEWDEDVRQRVGRMVEKVMR